MAGVVANREIVKEVMRRKLLAYLKYREFQDKEELDKETQNLTTQVKMQYNLNMIDFQTAQDFMTTIRAKYEAELKADRFKEWRENVAYYGIDGIISQTDRYFMIRKAEKIEADKSMKQTLTLAQWRDKIAKESRGSANGNLDDRNRNVYVEVEQTEKAKDDASKGLIEKGAVAI